MNESKGCNMILFSHWASREGQNSMHLGCLYPIIKETEGSDRGRWLIDCRASLLAQLAKNFPAMQENLIRFLGQEDPLEKG